MFKKISKILNLATKINIGLILFSIPIFFSPPFFKINNVFELPKNTLFHFLVLSLLFLTIVDFLFYREKAEIDSIKKVIKKNKFIFSSIFFYVLTLVLAFVFSDFKTKSFFGSYERQLGLASFTYFFIFFLLVFINLKRKEDFYRSLNTLVVSSFFISAYALVQTFGFDPFFWIESTELRAISSLGQPNFLGAFFLLVVPLNIYFFKKTINSLKYFYLINLFISILALGSTYSISSWIGGLFSLSIFFFLHLYINKDALFKKINYTYWLILMVFFIVVPFLFISDSDIFKVKINSVLNFESGSTSARINYWQASIKAIKKKPILGYGLDTQGEILAKYYETDWGVHSNVGVRPDRAHNIFLDILLTAGIFGLISYLLLLFLFFRIIWLNIKQKKELFLNIVIAISFSSYLVSLLFNFTFVVSEIIFWFYFAIILKIHFSEEVKYRKPQILELVKERSKIMVFLKIILVIVLAYLLFGKAKVEINKIIADKYYLDIRQARLNEEYFKSLVLYDYISELNLKTDVYDMKFGMMLAEWTPIMQEYGKIYSSKGTEYMTRAYKKIGTKEHEEKFSRALILSTLSRDDTRYLVETESAWQYLIINFPGIPENYYNLALFYFYNERYDESEKMLKEALKRVPEINDKNLNFDHLQRVKEDRFISLMLLGDIYDKKNNFEVSKKYYLEAEEIIKKPITYYRLANLHKEENDFESAIWYNKKAIDLDKNNHIWYYYLGETYFEDGDFKDSLIEINESLEIFPHHSGSILLKQEIENTWKK